MTYDNDEVFGATRVECDEPKCYASEEVEGFDGEPLPWSEVSKEIKKLGWIIKKKDGEFFHMCPKHSELNEW